MSKKSAKKWQQIGAAALGLKDDSASGKSKSKASTASLQPNKAPREEPIGNDLARLLGNRARALQLFQAPSFSADAFVAEYFRGLSERGIDNARHDLEQLLRSCATEVEGVVYEHHHAFLAACKGIEDLEDQVALLRNYANGQTELISTLKLAKGISKQVLSAARAASEAAPPPPDEDGAAEAPDLVTAVEDQMAGLLQDLDVAVAEGNLDAARAFLEAGNDAVAVLARDADLLALQVEDFPSWCHGFEAAIGERKQALTRTLERQLSDAAASRDEVRGTTHALGLLVGDCHAAGAMLQCYSHKLRALQGHLLRQHSSVGADPDLLEYAGSLMQGTLLQVARAADDLVIVFGVGTKDVAALYTVWAMREAREAAGQLRRNALTALAASAAGLVPSLECASLSLVFCAQLELSHQVSLTAAVEAELMPHVSALLKRHLKRFGEELRWRVSEEISQVVMQALAQTLPCIGPGGPPSVTLATAKAITSELVTLATALGPLAGPSLAAGLRRGAESLFVGYAQAISASLRGHLHACVEDLPLLQPLVPAVMEALAALIEEGIPDALAPLEKVMGPIVDPKELDKAINALYRECQGVGRAVALVTD